MTPSRVCPSILKPTNSREKFQDNASRTRGGIMCCGLTRWSNRLPSPAMQCGAPRRGVRRMQNQGRNRRYYPLYISYVSSSTVLLLLSSWRTCLDLGRASLD
ncbi:uncharacterized protein BJX67DRAFT_295495 [Aspergillus lucknowensis]|uniref:Uncharacterized protein n=1 Tax=Aspergillus lucknowensis TaxID=176173 RepID=A0ABR4LDQ1_9EURO